jgi:hypothetical protein
MDIAAIFVTFAFGLSILACFALAIALIPFKRPNH